MKAPAKPVDAVRYATADAGSIPAVSIIWLVAPGEVPEPRLDRVVASQRRA